MIDSVIRVCLHYSIANDPYIDSVLLYSMHVLGVLGLCSSVWSSCTVVGAVYTGHTAVLHAVTRGWEDSTCMYDDDRA